MTSGAPKTSGGTDERHQSRVERYFTTESRTWKDIYDERTVYAVIHQERLAWALMEIDALALRNGSDVLEVGCGAGLASVALAQRGLRVTAIDSTAEMVALTDDLARERHLEDRITASVAEVHELPFPESSFSLVIALGVLPWVHAPDRALEEMARIVAPGGYLVASVDNMLRLHYLLDPRLNPAFRWARRGLGRTLRRVGLIRSPAPLPVHLRARWSFDAAIARSGLEKVAGITHGFGPFTYLNRPLLSEAEGVRLHHLLQAAAGNGVLLLSELGAQYFVLARKPVAT